MDYTVLGCIDYGLNLCTICEWVHLNWCDGTCINELVHIVIYMQ